MKYSIIENIQKMTIICSFIMASLSMFSCNNKQKNLQKAIASEPIITLQKEKTRGDRGPRYKVEVFEEKVVKYTGLANVAVLGEQWIQLDKREYMAIIEARSATDFKVLAPSYKGGMRDLLLTSISVEGKKVTYNQDNCPKQLNELARLLEGIVRDKVLK